jgi:hypothetical protein
MQHSFKTRIARLGIGLLLLGSTTTAVLGAGAGAADAAQNMFVKATYEPSPGELIRKGEIKIHGFASPNTPIEIRMSDPKNIGPTYIFKRVTSDPRGNFKWITTEIPNRSCGKTYRVFVEDTSDGAKRTVAFRVVCEPQLGWAVTDFGRDATDRIVGRHFTPNGNVTLVWQERGNWVRTKVITASAKGTFRTSAQDVCGRKFTAIDGLTTGGPINGISNTLHGYCV